MSMMHLPEIRACSLPTNAEVSMRHFPCWPAGATLVVIQHGVAGGECGVPTYQHFKMPAAEYGKLWYSFDMGPVHFLQISTEMDFAAGSEQNR